ncbi:MAG TPA: DUF1415 domain-containing protein [Chitinophagaceae bacterium]
MSDLLMESPSRIIEQTKKWITDVVIGCNFCPFAAKELKKDSIHYEVAANATVEQAIDLFVTECRRLDENPDIETILLILPGSFTDFGDYLDLLELAEQVIKQKKYEGIYQAASFHPLYCFADADEDDAANYTNRSPYPMLHLLREESIETALENFPDPDSIPERNIHFARAKGLAWMKLLREKCF